MRTAPLLKALALWCVTDMDMMQRPGGHEGHEGARGWCQGAPIPFAAVSAHYAVSSPGRILRLVRSPFIRHHYSQGVRRRRQGAPGAFPGRISLDPLVLEHVQGEFFLAKAEIAKTVRVRARARFEIGVDGMPSRLGVEFDEGEKDLITWFAREDGKKRSGSAMQS